MQWYNRYHKEFSLIIHIYIYYLLQEEIACYNTMKVKTVMFARRVSKNGQYMKGTVVFCYYYELMML